MRAQRVRGGESRIEMQTVKWTAEGMGNGKRQVFHDVKVYVSYRRYAGISQRGMVEEDHKSRWHREWKRNDTRPWQNRIFCRGRFLYPNPGRFRHSTNFQAEKGGKSHVSHTGRNEKITETTDCRRIPACREIYSDAFTPIEVMRTLKAASRHCYLLESAENDQKWGR